MKHKKNIKGLSLIEILIVITIFAVIGLLSTRSVFLTLRSAKKSDSMIRVRENVNYSFSVIERQLRNAESITCPNPSFNRLDYISLEGTATSFACATSGQDKYVASGSGRLTSSDITVKRKIIFHNLKKRDEFLSKPKLYLEIIRLDLVFLNFQQLKRFGYF